MSKDLWKQIREVTLNENVISGIDVAGIFSAKEYSIDDLYETISKLKQQLLSLEVNLNITNCAYIEQAQAKVDEIKDVEKLKTLLQIADITCYFAPPTSETHKEVYHLIMSCVKRYNKLYKRNDDSIKSLIDCLNFYITADQSFEHNFEYTEPNDLHESIDKIGSEINNTKIEFNQNNITDLVNLLISLRHVFVDNDSCNRKFCEIIYGVAKKIYKYKNRVTPENINWFVEIFNRLMYICNSNLDRKIVKQIAFFLEHASDNNLLDAIKINELCWAEFVCYRRDFLSMDAECQIVEYCFDRLTEDDINNCDNAYLLQAYAVFASVHKFQFLKSKKKLNHAAKLARAILDRVQAAYNCKERELFEYVCEQLSAMLPDKNRFVIKYDNTSRSYIEVVIDVLESYLDKRGL